MTNTEQIPNPELKFRDDLAETLVYIGLMDAASARDPKRILAKDYASKIISLMKLKRPAERDGGWNHDIASAPMFLPIICFVRASRIPIQEESDMQYIAFQKRPGVFTLQDDDHTIIAPTCWRHLSAAPSTGYEKLKSTIDAASEEVAIWPEWKRNASTLSAPSPIDAAGMRAFGASDAACYHWPGDDEKSVACREAYCRGAADALPTPAREIDRETIIKIIDEEECSSDVAGPDRYFSDPWKHKAAKRILSLIGGRHG